MVYSPGVVAKRPAEFDLPPSKRHHKSDPPTHKEVLLTRYGLPLRRQELARAVKEKGSEILDLFSMIEATKPATLKMLVWEPAAIFQTIQVYKIIPRALSIFRCGQQAPDWLDRFLEVVRDVGKLSDYHPIHKGTLAYDSYHRIYKELETLFKKRTVDQDYLTTLLFYVDSFTVAESDRPSIQALTAVFLFKMQEFLRKVNGDPKILGLKSLDELFTPADCDMLKWPENRLQEVYDVLAAYEATPLLKYELQKALASALVDYIDGCPKVVELVVDDLI